MDWKVYAATFVAVFLAELADKTQLVGITMASKSAKPFTVWMGSVSAYIIVTAISVFLGTVLGKYMRPETIKYAAACLFIFIGILILWGKV